MAKSVLRAENGEQGGVSPLQEFFRNQKNYASSNPTTTGQNSDTTSYQSRSYGYN